MQAMATPGHAFHLGQDSQFLPAPAGRRFGVNDIELHVAIRHCGA